MQYLSSIDSDIYCILLVGLCQQSHSVEAAKLARSMLKKKIHLKAPYVDKIIEHLNNSGDKELVSQKIWCPGLFLTSLGKGHSSLIIEESRGNCEAPPLNFIVFSLFSVS
ncbi:hypothetical protein V6N12_021869 [Hibiscus sabdariffa]|uniref:Pentatricopeptide repeat-containing protein n=1 Tax=Hibiscus sabdariffa TaxID=183260 RepID=A0ABR2FT16_9ROSI